MPTTSSSRNHAARQVGRGRHPGQHHPAAGAGRVERGLQRLLAADRVDGDVDAAEEVRRGELRLELEGARRPTYAAQHLVGLHDLGRAELQGQVALVAVLGDDDDLAGRGELAQRQGREQADRSGAADQHPVVGCTPARSAVCTAHDERLHEQRLLVGPALGHHVHLAAVRDQLLAPAATGVLAEPGLQSRREVADGDPRAAVGVAGHAVLAGSTPRAAHVSTGSRTTRVPASQVLAVLEQLGDDLVAGHERQ